MSFTLHQSNGNDIRLFGLTNAERAKRMLAKVGASADMRDNQAEAAAANDSHEIHVNLDYAFDPAWFNHVAQAPGRELRDGDIVVLSHRLAGETAGTVGEIVNIRDNPTLYNSNLRKTETPFCLPLNRENQRLIERKSYYGAYKGVTDLLTKYLWPELAFHMTRGAAALGLTPNGITAIGAVLCVLAAWLFAGGHYWWGVAAGFGFMVLDTVDGKLARCTMSSSWWGNIFDHGIDLIHPPFWYYFWAVGLGAWGLAYDPTTFWTVQGILWGGYVVQRLIEGYFIYRFGIHIHVWRRFDSRFRLITARRNPNMILLVGGLAVGRPDIGLILVAVWTLVSLFIHVVQTLQAEVALKRGKAIHSWLTDK